MSNKFIFTKRLFICKSKFTAWLAFVYLVFGIALKQLRHFFSYVISIFPFQAFLTKLNSVSFKCRAFGTRVQNYLSHMRNALCSLSLKYMPTLHSFVATKFYNFARYKQTFGLCLCVVGCATLVLGSLVGFVSYREGYEVRRKVSKSLLSTDSTDLLKYKWDSERKLSNTSYRAKIDYDSILSVSGTPDSADKINSMVVFSDKGIVFLNDTADNIINLSADESSFTPVLSFDGSQSSALLAGILPSQYGEHLDESGRPLRWNDSLSGDLSSFMLSCAPAKNTNSLIDKILLTQAQLLPKFRPKSLHVRANNYRAYIEKSARKYGLSTDLVYAIIYSESNFIPVLVSPRSAMGLMQLMPETAGIDVHSFLYGHTTKLSAEQLFDPETNINYGTAYLYLLLNRDLVQIKNKATREYCAIASYNMGPNGFLRLFSRNRAKAIEIINGMTPQEIFLKLTTNFPIVETRNYVSRVVRSRLVFADF